MTAPPTTYDGYRALLADYLPRRRWFAAKGREFTIDHIDALPWLDGTPAHDGPHARIEFVTVAFTDGTSDVYQVPVAYLRHGDPDQEHALIGQVDHPELGPVVAYDGVYIKEATNALLEGFVSGRTLADDAGKPDLEFHTVEGAELPDSAPIGTVMPAEQSNTSIVFGEQAILKLFRRVSAGHNPDIEVHEALTRAGFDNVAPLLGWLSGRWTTADRATHEGDLGMLQVFLRTATDGWDLALASVRDLLDEEDLHPAEVGGDFAGESERLGEAVAGVHHELARLFPTTLDVDAGGATLASEMQARLEQAVAIVPGLAEHRAPLTERFDRLRRSDEPVHAQRVHGDLHLGQTLRTVKGWKIIDFEGEPAKSLRERASLSSPLRDVAGMLRSFDYAAGVTLESFGANPQLTYRADEWNTRNRTAFLAGYTAVAGDVLREHAELLAAFEADKAIYEAVYETRHRPTWVGIPMRAIARIAAEE